MKSHPGLLRDPPTENAEAPPAATTKKRGPKPSYKRPFVRFWATIILLAMAFFAKVGMTIGLAAGVVSGEKWMTSIGVVELWIPSLIEVPFRLVCLIVFIAWFARSYANLSVLAPKKRTFSADMAIGAWVIPVANFVIPGMIAFSLASGSSTRVSTRLLAVAWWVSLVSVGLSLFWFSTIIQWSATALFFLLSAVYAVVVFRHQDRMAAERGV